MSDILIGIYNHQTGQNETRPATPQEIEVLEQCRAQLLETNATAETKEKARVSALAKLAKLGLTEDEIKAL